MPSVAKELFHNKYWMKVEERAFYTDEWLENVGMMGVNSMEEAEALMTGFRQVRVTIPILAKYLAQDYKLAFIDKNDVPEMFNLINIHLDNWTQVTNRLGYVSNIPPIEDFEMLDALAEVLFPYRQVDKAILDIMSIFQGPVKSTNSMAYAQGVYKPYSPALYKYCMQART